MVSAIHAAPSVTVSSTGKTPTPLVRMAPNSKATPPESQPSGRVATDTVQISNAALAAMQEAVETPAQTAKEASGGDHQAQRLLAKEAAATKMEE